MALKDCFTDRRSRIAAIVLGTVLVASTPEGRAQGFPPAINPLACGSIKTGYGPFDYRTVAYDVRHRVEDFHFTPEVESLKAGATTALLAGDIDYTLRAMPNNYRALLALSRWSVKIKKELTPGAKFTTECYFERATRFVPDDPMPRILYAAYLRDRKRLAEMGPQLDEAERLRGEPSTFDLDYNLGLLYFDIGAYDKSMAAAKRAYALGAPLPALMNKLKSAGKWSE